MVLGALVELPIIRRFFRAPRLILTVVTLGLTQLLAVTAILLPQAWGGERLLAPRIDATVRPPLRGLADHLHRQRRDGDRGGAAGDGRAGACSSAYSSSGIAIRAERRQRRPGQPARRPGEAAADGRVVARRRCWRSSPSSCAAGILGLPVTSALSLGILLRSLAALMLGRMTNLPAIGTSAIALGVLETGVAWNAESPLLIDPILAVVIVVALLVRRRSVSRAAESDASTWQAAEEVRPVPRELRACARCASSGWRWDSCSSPSRSCLPHFLPADKSLKASAVLIYGILGLSLVVLTGWAGQVSLGQVAFFAIGAVAGAKLVGDWHLDLTLALVAAAVVGAAVAVVVGLPALRLRGLYLAVTTLAFSLATTSYLLNAASSTGSRRAASSGDRCSGASTSTRRPGIYYVALVGLLVVVVAVRGIRHSRTGRVLIALRENERTTEAVGVNAVRAKLTAFAISGAIASFAGCSSCTTSRPSARGPTSQERTSSCSRWW